MRNDKVKKYFFIFINDLIIILIFIGIVMFEKSTNKQIYNGFNKSTNQLNIEQYDGNSGSVEDIIENTINGVVGISKIKNNGGSIILKNNKELLGLGTGFIVGESGYIATNAHVCGEKYSTCYVTLEDGNMYDATVVWSDLVMDLAIVKINNNNLKLQTIKLGDSDKNRVGNVVYAIGNPIGFEFEKTVTKGIISAVNRTIKIEENNEKSYMEDLIQTDATINPGNSGGPLINQYGEVIGINTIKIDAAEGIGFAIPIKVLIPIIDSFNKNGKFEDVSLGLYAYDKEAIPYLYDGTNFENGVYVVSVNKNSKSYLNGIRVGDIILKIDDVDINKIIDLRKYIYTKYNGDGVVLKIKRNNKVFDVQTQLVKK